MCVFDPIFYEVALENASTETWMKNSNESVANLTSAQLVEISVFNGGKLKIFHARFTLVL